MAVCGKICENCAWREELQCAGCGSGGENGCCEIVSCCREKGHEDCHTCNFQLDCRLLRGREERPQRHRNAREEQEARHRWHAQHAPVLGKWLWLLFWLIIPNIIGGLMRMNSVVEVVPALRVPGKLLSIVCTILYGAFLWQLRDVDHRYKKASVSLLVAIPLGTVASFLDMGVSEADMGRAWLVILLSIPAMVLEFYACYLEYHSHGDALRGLDDELAAKWPRLWNWDLGLVLGLFGCILLLLIAPVLALIAVLADVVGLIVIGILRLVYYYRTAKLFREYPVPDDMTLPEKTGVTEE